ncbi:MAG: LuxR C-terminal-related transcriptional regulator, partial [Chloroflexota bacterium]|nr:LuxR C-terminal-related transcriptional regulator [Chloroflexota bacterium]
GHEREARAAVDELEPVAVETLSPLLVAALTYARPLVAREGQAERLFEMGLNADLGAWPFMRARLLLAYGEWLRRHRRVAESRAPLRAARDAMDHLGAAAWAERARQELRAAGESSSQRERTAVDALTPQELQIVQMAAEGMSNRDIGERLYLSHRTVGSHLYHAYPKLGVTSRAQLQQSLG